MIELLPNNAERVAFLQQWAADNNCTFEEEAEVGFGRECVGILSRDHYPAYRTYDPNTFDMIHECTRAYPPPGVTDAYHKADVLAVLGRGEDAICQLYLWVASLATHNIVVRRVSRRPANAMDLFVHGTDEPVLVEWKSS